MHVYTCYSPYVLHNCIDMGSLLGTALGTTRNYKRDPYVHSLGILDKANINSGSCRVYGRRGLDALGLRSLGGLNSEFVVQGLGDSFWRVGASLVGT